MIKIFLSKLHSHYISGEGFTTNDWTKVHPSQRIKVIEGLVEKAKTQEVRIYSLEYSLIKGLVSFSQIEKVECEGYDFETNEKLPYDILNSDYGVLDVYDVLVEISFRGFGSPDAPPFSKLKEEDYEEIGRRYRWIYRGGYWEKIFDAQFHKITLRLTKSGTLYLACPEEGVTGLKLAEYDNFSQVAKATANLISDYNQLFRGSKPK